MTRNGTQIVLLTAERFSVNPRLLLALIEHQSGWLANRNPSQNTLIYPLGYPQPGFEGLTRQLSWAPINSAPDIMLGARIESAR